MEGFHFNEDYFKSKEEDGFFISECMNRYRAASLVILSEFADIAERHSLRWTAAYGTMLGAVRHKGYIPWDDDLDIIMPRDDHEKFLAVSDEMPKSTCIDILEAPDHGYTGMTVVNNHPFVSFDEDVLQHYCFCPFRVGFDIYIYDYIPDDPTLLKRLKLDYLNAFKKIMERRTKQPDEKEWADRKQLSEEAEAVAMRYMKKQELCTKTSRLLTYAMGGNPVIEKADFDDIPLVPFETGQIRCIKKAEEYLVTFFGSNWRTPIISNEHPYPLYLSDLKAAVDFLEKGGIKLSDLPKELSYLKDEADLRGISYLK